jgi:hypothetical protein
MLVGHRIRDVDRAPTISTAAFLFSSPLLLRTAIPCRAAPPAEMPTHAKISSEYPSLFLLGPFCSALNRRRKSIARCASVASGPTAAVNPFTRCAHAAPRALQSAKAPNLADPEEAHVSNFLNKKRALSLEGLDRVMEAQGLTVEQILPVDLVAGAAEEEESDPVEAVPIVSTSAAIDDAQISGAAVIETVPVVGARLRENRAMPAARRTQWERFVAVRVDAQQASAMAPVPAAGALAVIDQHYNSLAPYRADQPNIYPVRPGSMLMLRYVDL